MVFSGSLGLCGFPGNFLIFTANDHRTRTMKQNIQLIFTGGTISMQIDPKTGTAVPTLPPQDLLKLVPGLDRRANLKIHDFGMFPGPHITPGLMLELWEVVQGYIKDPTVDGIVITHGTDTLEETAYFIDLMSRSPKPIVFTGSMRTSSEIGWDGLPNLIDSVAVACHEHARDLGVLVCLNGEINPASEVVKTHTDQMGTFQSPNFGMLGIVDKDNVYIYRKPEFLEYIGSSRIEPEVALLKTYTGMDGFLLDCLAGRGIRGIVVEAMGRGNVPVPVYDSILKAIEKGVTVVVVSRAGKGRVLDTYGYPGGGAMLRKAGVIFGGHLNGPKARIKLMVALGKTSDPKQLKEIFEHGRYIGTGENSGR